MILLDFHNRILEEAINQRLEQATAEKRDAVEITLADFDGVTFHITSDLETRNVITVSLSWTCAKELLTHGGKEILQKVYGNMLQATPEPKYDVSLQFNLASLPANANELPAKISLFKRHLLAGPFMQHFQAVAAGKQPPPPIYIRYRDEEGFFIKPQEDSVIVIFSMFFRDPDDTIYAKVFLQEFADARKSITSVPFVSFSQRDPPQELAGVPNISHNAQMGFVSFAIFKQHIDAKHIDKTVNLLQTFRDYLNYHIKCSKGYLHQRMRLRVDNLLQILNRAKTEPFQPREKKTISGKTFKAAGGPTPGAPKAAAGKSFTKGAPAPAAAKK